MIPGIGQTALSQDARFGALRAGLGVQGLGGSERFAGCGGFDARPPYYLGFDARQPLVRRIGAFVPGHRIVLEF